MLSSGSTELKANAQISRLSQVLHTSDVVWEDEGPMVCEDFAVVSQYSVFSVGQNV